MDTTPAESTKFSESRERNGASLEKLGAFLFLIGLASTTWAKDFVLLGQTRWSTKDIIQKTRFGGISGITFQGEKIFLISDDRGKVNEPRFYEFQIKKDKNIWKLENGQVHFTGLPSNLSDIEKRKQVLDQEAITALPNGNLLISSEGDGNKKPRIPPRIFEVKTSGEWVRDVLLPAIVMPEPTGQQKQGVGNNFAFEAMTTSPKGENLYFVSERPLLQDVDFKSEKNHFRFFQMKFKDDHFESPTEKYLEGPAAPVGNGIPVVQGFSEMTWVSEHQFLILDRTLKVLGGHTLSFECRLLEVELLESSATAKIQKIHPLKRGTEDLGNCEGMAFGPPTGEYKQTLWIINDNNFSASEDTVLYFFGVKN